MYYGPEWLITPCRVKHFVRLKGLKPTRGPSTTPGVVDLAVVEVFMRVEKLPYRVDVDAQAEQGNLLPQPTEEEITLFVAARVRDGTIPSKYSD